jgi:xanthine/CO dehydrogenase XdhC/CoxF family maturation factor
MTHEFKQIIEAYSVARKKGLKSVMASVVDLDGSSYRKPGVRMLILEDDTMIGAVSGGCVEKDILRQSKSVFETGNSKMMTYDGRFRLGCEGILYILLEECSLSQEFIVTFKTQLEQRTSVNIISRYIKEEGAFEGIGTYTVSENRSFNLSSGLTNNSDDRRLMFKQELPPCFKLMIFGGEHDAVELCKLTSLMGWEVDIFTGPSEYKTIANFPGATKFISALPVSVDLSKIDNQTAIMIMTHSFTNDLKWLMRLKNSKPAYLGLLGPVHKREKLIDQLLEFSPEIDETFLETIHGPAGLDIGSETPQEIAISVISEILAYTRKRKPIPLKEKTGNIHA